MLERLSATLQEDIDLRVLLQLLALKVSYLVYEGLILSNNTPLDSIVEETYTGARPGCISAIILARRKL